MGHMERQQEGEPLHSMSGAMTLPFRAGILLPMTPRRAAWDPRAGQQDDAREQQASCSEGLG